MGGKVLWRSDVVDWEKISVDSYRFVIEQAKERLNELVSESLAITSWGMKILFAYVAGLSGIAGYIYSEQDNFNRNVFSMIAIVPIAVFSIYVFTLIFSLVAGRNRYARGTQPKDLFREEIFKNINPAHGLKILLLNEIERMQEKIERIQIENKKRASQYKFVLQLSLLIIALLVFALVKKL